MRDSEIADRVLRLVAQHEWDTAISLVRTLKNKSIIKKVEFLIVEQERIWLNVVIIQRRNNLHEF